METESDDSEKPQPAENRVSATIDAVTGLAKAVPIYQDGIQPTVKELGKSLEITAKAIRVALSPIKALVWGADQLEDFLATRVAKKLENTPNEEIVSPKPNIAGPALEALRFTGHEEPLREMYANLLAASMDVKTVDQAHPSFVQIIKQLTPDEARLLELLSQPRSFPLVTIRQNRKSGGGGTDALVHFSTLGQEAGCQAPHLTPNYLDNLCRLGLASIPFSLEYTAPDAYKHLENHSIVQMLKTQIEARNDRFEIQKKTLQVTPLGKQFIAACITDHGSKRARIAKTEN